MDSFFAFFTLVTAEPASRNSTHVLQPLQPRVDQRITPRAHEWKRPPGVSRLCPLATPSAAIPELRPTATAACLGTVRPASWNSPGPIWTFAATAGRGRRSTAWVPPMRRSATGAAMIAPAEGAASSATARTASACFMLGSRELAHTHAPCWRSTPGKVASELTLLNSGEPFIKSAQAGRRHESARAPRARARAPPRRSAPRRAAP